MLGLCDCERVSGNHGDLQLLLVVTLWFDLHVHLVRSWCLRPEHFWGLWALVLQKGINRLSSFFSLRPVSAISYLVQVIAAVVHFPSQEIHGNTNAVELFAQSQISSWVCWRIHWQIFACVSRSRAAFQTKRTHCHIFHHFPCMVKGYSASSTSLPGKRNVFDLEHTIFSCIIVALNSENYVLSTIP